MSKVGCLYVVATPIGHLDDISQRALNTLRDVDLIAAEDTRHSGRLLAHFGIRTPQLSLHDHNEEQRTTQLIARLRAGESIALISDAGTPLISDPGYVLVSKIRAVGLPVSPIPGPSAVIAALSAAGLPTDRFVFEGFLPAKSGARQLRLNALINEPRTMVFYMSRHQITQQLADCAQLFDGGRKAVLAREVTKLHETFITGSLAEISAAWAEHPEQQKGELVLMVSGASAAPVDDEELSRVLNILLNSMGAKQAAGLAVEICGAAKNRAYKLALELMQARP